VTNEDLAYFARREREEREIAKRADDPAIAHAHSRLADAYARRLREATDSV